MSRHRERPGFLAHRSTTERAPRRKRFRHSPRHRSAENGGNTIGRPIMFVVPPVAMAFNAGSSLGMEHWWTALSWTLATLMTIYNAAELIRRHMTTTSTL